MASLWQKTLFYLGLVDDEQVETAEAAVAQTEPPSQVRTVEAAGSPRPSKQAAAPQRITRTSGVVAGRRIEPPASSRRRVSADPRLAEAGVYVQGTDAIGGGESEVIPARSFSDAQRLADYIRSGTPVVLDLRTTEPAMVRRLVDFSTGLTYALDGRMAKIGQGVILVTPAHTVIGVEEQERLAEMGLYQVAGD